MFHVLLFAFFAFFQVPPCSSWGVPVMSTQLEHLANDSNLSENSFVETCLLFFIFYLSPYKILILTYVIQMLSKSLLYEVCCHALTSPKGIVSCDHYLIFVKDKGVLLHPLEDTLSILKTCEVYSILK